jgi:hypothetical protein
MSEIDSEPVVGWRLWKVKEDELRSWAVKYVWEPGDNKAVCLADGPHQCPEAPGRSCRCGFWALYSPLAAIRLAAATPAEGEVIGLIEAFGTVAVHGREGFRAEMARVSCLFADEIALVPLERIWRCLRRRLHRAAAGLNDPIPRRIAALKPVASRYAVPLVFLQSAVSLGLLGELGVEQDAIAELQGWLKPSRTKWRWGRAELV